MEIDLITNKWERRVKRFRVPNICEEALELIIQELVLEVNKTDIPEMDACATVAGVWLSWN